MVRVGNDSPRPSVPGPSSLEPSSAVRSLSPDQVKQATRSSTDRYQNAQRPADPGGQIRAQALQNAQDYVRQNRPDIPAGLLKHVRTEALQNGSFLGMGQRREERMDRFEGAVNRSMSNMQSQMGQFEGWLAQKEEQQKAMFNGMTGSDFFQAMKAAEPPPATSKDRLAHGQFIGAGGQAVGSLDQAEAVAGKDGKEGTVLYVNGVNSHIDEHQKDMEALAATGPNVVGLYAAPWTSSEPVVQAIGDAVVDKVLKGESLHIVAHSQGALFTARGVEAAYDKLALQLGPDAARDKLRELVQVETHGASLSDLPGGYMAWRSSMPDGPRYVHYMNEGDSVSKWFGWGLDKKMPWNRAGADARFLLECGSGEGHELSEYMKNRTDFETAWKEGTTR